MFGVLTVAKILGVDLIGSRLLVAELESRKSTVVKVMTSDLPAELKPENAHRLGEWLKSQLAAAGMSAKDAVCTLGRDRVTLRSIEMPVCPEPELPAMVAFEAEDSWNQPGVEPVVDFEAGPVGEMGREVFVAMAAKPMVDTLVEMLSTAGLTCHHMSLRPHATHHAWHTYADVQEGNTLFVVPGDENFDLSIWLGRQLASCRSLKFNATENPSKRIVSEVRRTIVSHHSHFPDAQVERVIVCAPNHYSLAEALREELGIPVDRFDLTQHLEVDGGELNAGIVAAVGAALQQFSKQPWPIDLLNPKKPPVVRDRTRSVAVMAGLLLALLPIGAVVYGKQQIAEKQRQIDFYAQELGRLNAELAARKPMLKRHEEIANWAHGEMNWLNELQELSARLPDTSELYLTRLDMGAGKKNEPGSVALDVRTRLPSTVTERITQLAQHESARYSVKLGTSRFIDDSSEYVYFFALDAKVEPLSDQAVKELGPTWKETLAKLEPKDGTRRVPIELQRPAAVAKASNSTSSAKSEAAKPQSESTAEKSDSAPASKPESSATAAKTEQPSTSGSDDDGVDLIERLKAMSYEEREAKINSLPRFLQMTVRKKLKESGS